ncbi:MAG: hypothetical protein OEY44_04310, partial [Candidatus Peregrinibacteria bacterium]|nr:hypothetical protein [Candidatus Peregrinibacteria bacterium]
KAGEEADDSMQKAEDEEREKAREQLVKAKEEAKSVYSKLIVDADNSRRDVIEGGKTKVSKGKSHVVSAFMAMFE